YQYLSMSSNSSDFQCPNGYVKESITPQLFYEDLDEDSEIWLIRVPSDLNPTAIENQKIILDGDQHILECDENSRFEYISDPVEQTKLSIILPQKSDGKLRSVKKGFAGSVFFNEDIIIENSEVKIEVDNTSANDLNFSSSALCEGFENSFSIQALDNPNSSVESKKSKKKKRSSLKIKREKTSDADEFPECNSQR
ncbi:uncharacterized protein, partial [Parasteatoda tepidariorum]|uniref:uncharacterized protein n=1 Tax=Parasteatoda tepidariorum TaxID=114398 RepID=UPI0039BD5D3D